MSDASKKELIQTMFAMQDSFNKHVHIDWKSQNFAWNEAILVESAELIEHLGYKWWKHQEPDMNQVIMEMVDIWHFGMSYVLDANGNDNITDDEWDNTVEIINSVEENFTILDAAQIRGDICELVHHVTALDPYESYFCFESFFAVWYGLGKNFNDLYKMYIGKNALNIFRQNNGYKTGTYVKIWSGREDNEHLTDYLEHADINEHLMKNVLEHLDEVYQHRDLVYSVT